MCRCTTGWVLAEDRHARYLNPDSLGTPPPPRRDHIPTRVPPWAEPAPSSSRPPAARLTRERGSSLPRLSSAGHVFSAGTCVGCTRQAAGDHPPPRRAGFERGALACEIASGIMNWPFSMCLLELPVLISSVYRADKH